MVIYFLLISQIQKIKIVGLPGPHPAKAIFGRAKMALDPKTRPGRPARAVLAGVPHVGQTPAPVTGGSAAKFVTGSAQPPIAGTTGRTTAAKTSCSIRLMGTLRNTGIGKGKNPEQNLCSAFALAYAYVAKNPLEAF